MNTHTIAHYQLYISRAAAVLAAVCAVSVFLYGIFLLMAVVHTVARTDAQRNTDTITAHLGDLEMDYFSKEKELTPQYAQALGFVTPSAVSAVYASAAAHTLTINANR